jgi:hypothetical protein
VRDHAWRRRRVGLGRAQTPCGVMRYTKCRQKNRVLAWAFGHGHPSGRPSAMALPFFYACMPI